MDRVSSRSSPPPRSPGDAARVAIPRFVRSWKPALPALGPTLLTLLAAVWFTMALNTAFWRLVAGRLDQGVAGSPLLVAQLAMFLLSVTVFLLSFFRFPYVLKPVLIGLLLCSSAAAYFMDEYRIMIDRDMLRNVFQTDKLEVQGLLSWTLLGYVLLLGVLPAVIVACTRLRWSTPVRNGFQTLGVIAVALVLALGSLLVDFKASAPFLREQGKELQWRALPLNLMLGFAWLARDSKAMASQKPFEQIATTVTLAPQADAAAPSVTILVVGETSRAANWSLNGYPRPTNPALAKLRVTSFTDVSSCGTATATSLPCMFSGLGRADYSWNKVDNRENLLDIAKRAGYRVVWIDNQAGSKGASARVETREVPRGPDASSEPSDLALIPQLEALLAARDRHLLVVMHQMGSHGPEYYKRSVAETKAFAPECTEKQLERCPLDTIRNAYDNTIVTTDRTLAGLIEVAMRDAPDRAVSLLYVSDHGESLGENGLFLHGMPYALAPREQTHVPMVFWTNARAEQRSGVTAACADELRDAALSHDHYFDTVLGLLRIESDAYRPERDAFSVCRAAHLGGTGEHQQLGLAERYTPR